MLPFVTTLLCCIVLITLSVASAKITNQSIDRVIDVTKAIARVTIEIEYKKDSSDSNTYTVLIPSWYQSHLSVLSAKSNGKEVEMTRNTKSEDSSTVAYDVPISKDDGKIKLTMFLTHVLTPFPKEIRQSENQFVLYSDSHTVPSLYKTESQSTVVKLASSEVESVSGPLPKKSNGARATFGPYENVDASTSIQPDSLKVHFKHHGKFLTLTNVVKEIEVSMWGRVSVEEVYDLLHSGAKLIGGFSRFDYSQNQKSASFSNLFAILPADAENVYYRDIIGNVTTSRLRVKKTHQELELQPRFPIFGGWKTQWYMGYRVPTETVLTHVEKAFTLTMEFSTPVSEATVDELTVKVILPEGATNVAASIPFDIESEGKTTRKTYLDSSLYGRPVLVLYKKNLVPHHNVPFTVTFDFDQKSMLHEPLLLIASFMAFFLLSMVLLRLDFSLAPKASVAKASVEKKTQ